MYGDWGNDAASLTAGLSGTNARWVGARRHGFAHQPSAPPVVRVLGYQDTATEAPECPACTLDGVFARVGHDAHQIVTGRVHHLPAFVDRR